MSQRTRFALPTLSRAQAAIINPENIEISSANSTVLALTETGLHENAQGIFTFSLIVERSEYPGHPLQLTGLASLAKQLSQYKKGDTLSFVGTVSGSLSKGRRPYAVLSEVGQARDEE